MAPRTLGRLPRRLITTLGTVIALSIAAPVQAATDQATNALLQCDGPVYASGVLEATEPGGATPEKALTAFPRGPNRPLPKHGYSALHRTADAVTFVYRHNDRIRAAVRVERDVKPPAGLGLGDPWTFTGYAGCDPAEFAPSADDEIGMDLVRTADGTRLPAQLLNLSRQNSHCFPGLSALAQGRGTSLYFRDPQHTLADEVLVPYQADATLPPTAVDTGLRTRVFALFATPDARAIYAVGPDHTERWPARLPQPARLCG